jgi:hypothetical protein
MLNFPALLRAKNATNAFFGGFRPLPTREALCVGSSTNAGCNRDAQAEIHNTHAAHAMLTKHNTQIGTEFTILKNFSGVFQHAPHTYHKINVHNKLLLWLH